MKLHNTIISVLFAVSTPCLHGQEHTATNMETNTDIMKKKIIGRCRRFDEAPSMCHKLPMQPDGIIRLSKIEVYPEYLEEYLRYAMEVGEVSLRTEPGVLTMYAVAEKENPCNITILETYASEAAYKSHIASPHFRKYKQATLLMVRSLVLSDQKALNPANEIKNYMKF